MKDKKILYLMPVSWSWIRQRPHFVSKELSEYFSVQVACLSDFNCDSKLKSLEEQNKYFRLYSFPIVKTKKNGKIHSIINFYIKKLYLNILLFRSDIIIFTVPQQIIYPLKGLLKKKLIIYDCMDDMPAFYNHDPKLKNMIGRFEKELCSTANLIFVSSLTLKDRIAFRYSVSTEKLKIVNNGIRPLDFSKIQMNSINNLFADKSYRYIVYFGTVSEWFDIELMERLITIYKNVKLVIFGPSDIKISHHSQIIYGGILPHNQIEASMALADALIMPFKRTELVLAVNPVKAYEYVASGKPVILAEYAETKNFEKFAYLYDDFNSVYELFSAFSKNELKPKRSIEECYAFGKENTWSKRAQEIANNIEAAIEK